MTIGIVYPDESCRVMAASFALYREMDAVSSSQKLKVMRGSLRAVKNRLPILACRCGKC
jgi:hypothetical protein